jgi:V/A-type H+/Na+-transporting ATPase subunit E
MNAEQVVEKILADARAEADSILGQAASFEQEEEKKIQQNISEYNRQTALLAQKAAEEKKSRLLASARMETAKENLAEKRRILDEVFEQARRRLMQLADNEYLQLMSKLLTEAVQRGDEEVIVDKNERRIDENFIKQKSEKLGPDRKGNLRLSQEKEAIGAGFILKRGKIKTNASIDVLLNQARETIETELAKQLFAQ